MNLLIEIYSEEIPARMQRAALTNSQEIISKLLTEQGLTFTETGSFIAPQRLAIFAKGLPETTQSLTEERRGPRTNAPEAALSGFLKSTDMTIDQLEIRGDYYYAHIVSAARPVHEMLPDVVHGLLDSMPWPKSMRWHNPQTNDFTRSWIRPIRAITVMLDDKAISFPVNGLDLATDNTTFGHRFLKPESIQLKGLEGKMMTTFKVMLNTEDGINVYVFENPFTNVLFAFSTHDLPILRRRVIDSFTVNVDDDGKIYKSDMVVGHTSSDAFIHFVHNQTFILLEETS